jgi:hypothetical protein
MGSTEPPAKTVAIAAGATDTDQMLTLKLDPASGRLRWLFECFDYPTTSAYGALSPAGPAGVVSYRGLDGVELRFSYTTGRLTEILAESVVPAPTRGALRGLIEWHEGLGYSTSEVKNADRSASVHIMVGAERAFEAWATSLIALGRLDATEATEAHGVRALQLVDALAATCRAVEHGLPEGRLIQRLSSELRELLGTTLPGVRLHPDAALRVEELLGHSATRSALGSIGVDWLVKEMSLSPNHLWEENRPAAGSRVATLEPLAEVLHLGQTRPANGSASLDANPGKLLVDQDRSGRSSVTVPEGIAVRFGLVSGCHQHALRIHPGWFELELPEASPAPWYVARWVHCFDGNRLIGAGPMRSSKRGLFIRMWDPAGVIDTTRASLIMTGHPCPPVPDASIVRLYAEAVHAARCALALRDMGDQTAARAYWSRSAKHWLTLGATENAGWAWQLAEPHALTSDATLRSQLEVLALAHPSDLEPTTTPFIAPLVFDSSMSYD